MFHDNTEDFSDRLPDEQNMHKCIRLKSDVLPYKIQMTCLQTLNPRENRFDKYAK